MLQTDEAIPWYPFCGEVHAPSCCRIASDTSASISCTNGHAHMPPLKHILAALHTWLDPHSMGHCDTSDQLGGQLVSQA